jgi:hypothetical protein
MASRKVRPSMNGWKHDTGACSQLPQPTPALAYIMLRPLWYGSRHVRHLLIGRPTQPHQSLVSSFAPAKTTATIGQLAEYDTAQRQGGDAWVVGGASSRCRNCTPPPSPRAPASPAEDDLRRAAGQHQLAGRSPRRRPRPTGSGHTTGAARTVPLRSSRVCWAKAGTIGLVRPEPQGAPQRARDLRGAPHAETWSAAGETRLVDGVAARRT